MPEPIRVQVKIDHRNYHLVSTEPEAYLHKVAAFVNDKIAEIESRNQFIGTDVKMVLTALNLAEDAIKAQNETVELQRQVKELQTRIEELEVELDCVQEDAPKAQMEMFDKGGKSGSRGNG